MNKNNCDMIRDLLPLYVEDMCSEESRKVVTEHLTSCSECRNELKKLNTNVAVKADTDISALRKVKKKIRITKIIIAVIAVLVGFHAAFFAYFFPVNTCCSIDYEKYSLAENVWAEEDSEGNVWLCRKGAAAAADIVIPTLSDTDGNHMGYGGKNGNKFGEPAENGMNFDKNKLSGFGVTFQHRKIKDMAIIKEMSTPEERSLLFNVNEKPDLSYAFYYDDVNNKEYVLWTKE